LVDAVRELKGRKRDVMLERSLEASLAQSSARLDGLLTASSTSPSAQTVKNEQIAQLSRALAGLADDQRMAVEPHYLDGRSVAAIAEQLGRTERSVAGLVRRGLKRLRGLMAHEWD
jgi:RNA polymerase sigma-70 factor, ECF subfamily